MPPKTCAILSRGPSLAKYEAQEYDAIIGVNNVVEKWACDWWAFADWDQFVKTKPIGTPKIFTRVRTLDKLRHFAPDHVELFKAANATTDIAAGIPLIDKQAPFYNWSGPLALGLAYMLGAEQVDCYGCDMGGNEDAFGHKNNGRNAWRWAEEKKIWARLEQLIAARGGRVRRIA